MDAISFGVGAIAVGVVMWVYFDASERGKNAILWALATILSWGLVFFLYLLVRNSGQQHVAVSGAGTRRYLYVASFCGAFLVAIGLSVGLGALLASAFDNAGLTSDVRDLLASGIVAAAVGFAILTVHWHIAEHRLDGLPDDEFRAQFATRRVALQTTTATSGFVAVFSALVLFGGGLSELLGASYSYAQRWVPAAAPFIVTGTLALLAWRRWLSTDRSPLAERFRSIPAPPLTKRMEPAPSWPPPPTPLPAPTFAAPPAPQPQPPLPGAPRFCSQCGAIIAADTAAFCSSCGTRLVRASPSADWQPPTSASPKNVA